ncbi:MAG: TadG family pilus assembly protein [Rhodoblastus sp.]
MSRFTSTPRALLRDDSGSVSIMAASAIALSVGLAAISVDSGLLFVKKRSLQAATDLAAIAAASSSTAPRDAALRTLAANGYGASTLVSLETGAYVADAAISPGARFQAATPGSGAVRIRTSIDSPVFFAPALSLLFTTMRSEKTERGGNSSAPALSQTTTAVGVADRSSVQIGASAVALRSDTASFSIGSRLLGLNGGVVNALLGGLLGANVTLSVMDYQALADADVDLFKMTQALATRLSLRAVSYDQVAAMNLRPADILAAAASVAPASASLALQALANAAGVTGSMKLSSLVAYGGYGGLDVTSSAPIALAANALGLVSGVAQVGNGARQIDLDLGAQVPGLLGLRLSLAVGERPVSSKMAASGVAGSAVYTAQTRLRLVATVGGGALGANLSVPLYVDVAMASAQLAAVQCGATGASVQLAVTPGVLNAAIADVTDREMAAFAQAPAYAPAPLATLPGLVSLRATAHAQMSNTAATMVSYTPAEISAGVRKTVSTRDYVSSLASSLLGDLTLSANIAGLTISTGALGPAVSAALAPAAAPLDGALYSILSTLGVGIGQADTWVTGVSCGYGVLVN